MWLFSSQKLTSFPQFYTLYAQFASLVNHHSDSSFPITQWRVNVVFGPCKTIYAVNQLKNNKNNKTSQDVVCSFKSLCLSVSPRCTLTWTLTLRLVLLTLSSSSSSFCYYSLMYMHRLGKTCDKWHACPLFVHSSRAGPSLHGALSKMPLPNHHKMPIIRIHL